MWDFSGSGAHHTNQGTGGVTLFPPKGYREREEGRVSIDGLGLWGEKQEYEPDDAEPDVYPNSVCDS